MQLNKKDSDLIDKLDKITEMMPIADVVFDLKLFNEKATPDQRYTLNPVSPTIRAWKDKDGQIHLEEVYPKREQILDNIVPKYFNNEMKRLRDLAQSRDKKQAMAYWGNFIKGGFWDLLWTLTFAAKPKHRLMLSQYFGTLHQLSKIFVQKSGK